MRLVSFFEQGNLALLYPNKKLKTIAAIPAYNEEKFIGEVVHEAQNYVHQIIVIDDGSTDATAEVAAKAGTIVIRHETNKNYGGAIKSCFDASRKYNADLLVTLDGDGQHKASEIPLLIKLYRILGRIGFSGGG